MIFQPLIWWRNGVLCYNDWMNDDEIDIYWCVPIMAFHINFKILNDPKCYKSHLIHVIINYVTLYPIWHILDLNQQNAICS